MSLRSFARFGAVLGFFHVSEFTLAAVFDRVNLSVRSLLLSRPYCVAMTLAALENAIEWHYLPEIKASLTESGLSMLGLVLVVAGEFVRKAAMVTAKQAFTHEIQTSPRKEHVLVTRGVYAYLRHPGYFGWFWWAVGTQVMLCNPVCTVLFAVLAAAFFRARIPFEERSLLLLFGEDYRRYARATPLRLPFRVRTEL